MPKLQPKIIFAGYLDSGSTSRHRANAFRRIGFEVAPFNFSDYLRAEGKVMNWVLHRGLFGPTITRINRDLIDYARREKPDYIYIEKGIFLTPATVKLLSKEISPTIQFNYDNPFGPRKDPGWRLLVESIPYYSLHLVPRESNIEDYRNAGAKYVYRMPLTYDPMVHYPPPPSWNENNRTIDVSFTGAPYDNRAEFMSKLLTDHGIAVDIRGDRWSRLLSVDVARKIYKGPGVYEDAYRQRFWDSKICLSFVTHGNLDLVAHRSLEIVASAGFLLAEATDEHLALFEDGKEAVFFTDEADCARLIKKYLPEPELRERIAKNGYKRAVESGYSNDARLLKSFNLIQELFPR